VEPEADPGRCLARESSGPGRSRPRRWRPRWPSIQSPADATEAADRLQRFGPNELVERGRKPPWRLLTEQFANTIILVLIAAAAIAAVIGDLKDTIVILAIVVLNAVVGFVQEYRAEQAMAALMAMAAPASMSSATATSGWCRPPSWCPATSSCLPRRRARR
jgi:hypothetical protein